MVAVAGVDGCPGGWICVFKASPDAAPAVGVFRAFADMAATFPGDAIIAVDMPIGLPDKVAHGGRGPEQAIRPLLKARQSSVFSVPSRAAVYAEPGQFGSEAERLAAHKRASQVALNTSDPPRKISIQAFGLFAKIRELDTWLREEMERSRRVIESHPEFAFTVLNNGKPMSSPKKTKGRVNLEGMAERRDFLAAKSFDPDFLNQPTRARCQHRRLSRRLCDVAGRRASCQGRGRPPILRHTSTTVSACRSPSMPELCGAKSTIDLAGLCR